MIIYFSATGNCKFVAQKIAEATKDSIVSLTEIDSKIKKYDIIDSNKSEL